MPHGWPGTAGAGWGTLRFHPLILLLPRALAGGVSIGDPAFNLCWNTSFAGPLLARCLQSAARTEIRRRKGCSALKLCPLKPQMTVPRLWDRLKPTAPETKWLAVVYQQSCRYAGITANLLISEGSSCATGLLIMRKGRHALIVRSATERPA
jgi:hypothetical protein